MEVTIDTNIFVSDFNLDSPHARVFIDGLTLVPAKLHISEIVLDETINKFRETLEQKAKQLNELQNEVNRLLRRSNTLDMVHTHREIAAYEKNLRDKLENIGANILPYPKSTHKEIVGKILQRRKPFKSGDAGYRDFLVWDSIRRLETYGAEEIVFITNNTRDFGTGPYLPDDFVEKRTKNKNFKIVLSLSKFNEEYILPRLKKLELLKGKLQEEKIENFDFKEWLNKHLLTLLADFDLEDVIVGFPNGVGNVKVTNIVLFNDYKIEMVKELESGDKLLSYFVNLTVEASVSIDWDDFENYNQVREYFGETDEFFSLDSSTNAALKIRGNLILHKDKLDVISEEITFIDGPYASIDME